FEREKSFVLKSNSKKFLIYKNGEFNLNPGDLIKVEGYLIDSYKGNPHEESFYIYNLTEGIKGFFYAEKINIIKKDESLISKIREKLNKNLEKLGTSGEILKGFILGGGTVDSYIKEIFKYSGVIHVLAISGIHLSILAGVFSLILDPIIVILILFIYLIIILFPVSALRAFFMYSFYLLGKKLKREVDALNTLLFSAMILILINPINIISPSFLLTFISTLSIITISEKIKNNFLKFFIVPSFITVGSFPVLIYFFPFFSLTTLISNIVFIPLISIFLPIFFFFSIISIIFENIIILLKLPLIFLEKLTLFFSNFKISSIGIKKPNLIFLILFFVLYFILILIFLNEV
ncbi:MAG: ComEC/Rec2 family competence protein, partial [Caldisericia bacterium]|nr:ComEC/Rec2 family competence protein [Caldisericia bacterium]